MKELNEKQEKYCSINCKNKGDSRENSKLIDCDECSRKIKRWNSHIKKHNFCSKKCNYLSKKKNLNKGNFKNGKNHPNWKGDLVGITGLHRWIRIHNPKPSRCEKCGMKKELDLANISGEYKRDIKDYKWLCRKCHISFDKLNRIKKRELIYDEIISIDQKNYNKSMWDIETETKNFIAEDIITHNSKRSKIGQALGIYLPSLTKEKIDIVIGVDTSGSIGEEELTKFLSEMVAIARIYRDRVSMRVLFHDTEVQADYEIKNGNIAKILAMKIKGGGGTSHKYLFDKVKKEIRNCKCLISFTDGFSDIEDINLTDYRFRKMFVINKEGTIPKIKRNLAEIIKLKED